MDSVWHYVCGELCARMTARVFRRDDRLLGKVVRTYGNMIGDGLPSDKPHRVVVRYFVWDLPDDAPEYETEAQAEAAVREARHGR